MTTPKLLRTLAAIHPLALRVQAIGDRVERLQAPRFVAALEVLVRDAGRGSASADADAVLACALWLAHAQERREGRSRIDELHAAAKDGGHAIATAMLDDDEPHKQLSRHGRLSNSGGAASSATRDAGRRRTRG